MSLVETEDSISFALGMEKELFPNPVIRDSNDLFFLKSSTSGKHLFSNPDLFLCLQV